MVMFSYPCHFVPKTISLMCCIDELNHVFFTAELFDQSMKTVSMKFLVDIVREWLIARGNHTATGSSLQQGSCSQMSSILLNLLVKEMISVAIIWLSLTTLPSAATLSAPSQRPRLFLIVKKDRLFSNAIVRSGADTSTNRLTGLFPKPHPPSPSRNHIKGAVFLSASSTWFFEKNRHR